MKLKIVRLLPLYLIVWFCIATTSMAREKDRIKVEIDGVVWKRVNSLSKSLATDHHYMVARDDDGNSYIIFGDGKHGSRPKVKADTVRDDLRKHRYKGVLIQEGRVRLDRGEMGGAGPALKRPCK